MNEVHAENELLRAMKVFLKCFYRLETNEMNDYLEVPATLISDSTSDSSWKRRSSTRNSRQISHIVLVPHSVRSDRSSRCHKPSCCVSDKPRPGNSRNFDKFINSCQFLTIRVDVKEIPTLHLLSMVMAPPVPRNLSVMFSQAVSVAV